MSSYFNFDTNVKEESQSSELSEIYFDPDCAVFAGHYPEHPIFPASLLCDFCLEQVGPASDGHWWIEEATFSAPIRPGDAVNLVREREAERQNFTFMRQSEVVAKMSLSPRTGVPELLQTVSPSTVALRPAAAHLPQSYPLIAVDRVGVCEETGEGAAQKLVSFGDYFFSNIAPGALPKALYPSGPVIEGIEQAASVSLGRIWEMDDPSKVIQVAALRGIAIAAQAAPGEVIDFHAKVTLQSDKLALLTGYAAVGARLLVSIEKIYVVRLEAGS